VGNDNHSIARNTSNFINKCPSDVKYILVTRYALICAAVAGVAYLTIKHIQSLLNNTKQAKVAK